MPNFWHQLPRPFTVLAPMDDVTDTVFRDIVATTARPDVFFTEFTSAQGLFSPGRDKVMTKLRYSQIQRPIVAQIWGARPDFLAQAAMLVQDLGFDGVDINMGCPERNVMKMNSGAALIKNEQLAGEIITAVQQAVPQLLISVKTRLAPSDQLTTEWLTFLLSHQISALTLHARTAKELSKVDARWVELKQAVQLRDRLSPATVIIGNGDVKSYAEVLEKQKLFGVDGVMIGRGIFHDPWVFDQTLPAIAHSTKERLALLLKHAQLFDQTWGKTKNFAVMKKFFKMYVKGFAGADELRQNLMACQSTEEIKTVVTETELACI